MKLQPLESVSWVSWDYAFVFLHDILWLISMKNFMLHNTSKVSGILKFILVFLSFYCASCWFSYGSNWLFWLYSSPHETYRGKKYPLDPQKDANHKYHNLDGCHSRFLKAAPQMYELVVCVVFPNYKTIFCIRFVRGNFVT